MEYRPLVSVIVLTYNSGAYVLETLESVRRQTYSPIELIVTDDGSRDDTVALCRAWLEEHRSALPGARLLVAAANGGVTRNCNNGLAAANGEWIKLIAGDDCLLDNGIAGFVACAGGNRSAGALFSEMRIIDNASTVTGNFPSRADFFSLPPEVQLSTLVYDNLLPAPAGFINRRVLLDVGGFDPDFPMMEDWPLWVKLLSKGYRLGYLGEVTVSYRLHDAMVSLRPGKLNPVFVRSRVDFARKVRRRLADTPRLRLKVRRDILFNQMRQHTPVLFHITIPVLWWGWNLFKRRTVS